MSLTAVIVAVVVLLAGVLGKVAIALITDDVKGWLPHASKNLVNKAADLLPPEQQERWRAEWQADLVEYTRDGRRLAGLAYAFEALRAASKMRRKLRPELQAETAKSADADGDKPLERKNRLRSYVTFAAAAVDRVRGRLHAAAKVRQVTIKDLGKSRQVTVTIQVGSARLRLVRDLARMFASLHGLTEPIAALGREFRLLVDGLSEGLRGLTRALPAIDPGTIRAIMRLTAPATMVGVSTSSVLANSDVGGHLIGAVLLVLAALTVVMFLLDTRR